MKHVRIALIGNESFLTYTNGLIHEVSPIYKDESHRSYSQGLKCAYRRLRLCIQDARHELRHADKLESKGSEGILRLLNNKRRAESRVVFSSKRPLNRSKHVGVEIEFISKSKRDDIALDLAKLGVAQFVELKGDGSVRADSDDDFECDGTCRENCECADCGEKHYCDDEADCRRRVRNYGACNEETWEVKDDCDECDMLEVTETDENGNEVTKMVSDCQGHCPGHYCLGYDDHEDYECQCECDCSGGNDSGHEIAIVAKSTQIEDVLTKVCKALAMHNAEVNNTCGLHVHIDMRGHDEVKAFSNLVKSQFLLYAMCPVSRFRNHFCVPNTYTSMEGHNGRYWGINPQSYDEHKTLEIRLHSGSVTASKIINWVRLLQKIAYSKQKMVNASTLSQVTDAVKIKPELLEYVRERLAKFQSSHKTRFIDDLPKPGEMTQIDMPMAA